MSRFLDDRLRSRADDGGFGLVEIMIAMTILAIVAVSTAPMLLGGLRAGRAAQLNLQGKALAQERLEKMRNLPYHVAQQNGQYVDVLDIYFRDLQAFGAVAAGDTCSARSYDAGSATYSCTIESLGDDYAGFSQKVKARFLGFERNPITPPNTYDSQVTGNDGPASALLGVEVTTSWSQGSDTSSYTLRSQIANAQSDASTLQASLDVAALQLTSELASGDVLQLEGGLVSSNGSLTTGSTANLNVATARAGLSSGLERTGALLSLSAPPFQPGSSPTGSGQKLDGTCDYACFGKTAVTGNADVTVALGQPQVSTDTDPVASSLARAGENVFRGFTFGNAPLGETDPLLELAGPMVSAGATGSAEVLRGEGYLNAAGTGSTAVRTGGKTFLPMLELFPTSFAPDGVVQVTLDDASLTCTSGAGTGSVDTTWSGTVRYWQQTGFAADGVTPTGDYVPLAVAPGAAALPGPDVVPVLKANPTAVYSGVATGDVALGRWIDSWSAASDTAAVATSAGPRTTAALPAVVSVLTQPTRASAPTSAINISVGSLACQAEDNR